MAMNVGDGENQGSGYFGSQGLLTDINITPFVDVILVLLIIFMVTAPLAISGVDVHLPANKSKALKLKDEPLVLSVSQSGAFYLGKVQIPMEEMAEKLKTARSSEKDAVLYIRADRQVPYGRVMEAMAAAQAAGILKVAMLTEPGSEGKK